MTTKFTDVERFDSISLYDGAMEQQPEGIETCLAPWELP
jgi:hypothetical protein